MTIRPEGAEHDFDRQHLRDAIVASTSVLHEYELDDDDDPPVYPAGCYEAQLERIELGFCPRCEWDEGSRLHRIDPGRAIGSLATTCRCVPICEDCALDEADPSVRFAPPSLWPIPGEVMEENAARRQQ